MNIDWKQISPPAFEKLCATLLGLVGFTNIQWYGEAGSDKGRDILAERIDSPLPGVQRTERWMIQCKRYTKSTLTKSELKELLDTALEHKIDSLLIIATTRVSANLRDWLTGTQANYPFRAHFWEEVSFRRLIQENIGALVDAVPELTDDKDPLWLYDISEEKIYLGCNNFEDVEILVRNVKTMEEAKIKAGAFLTHLRKNGFEWWEKQ